MDAADIQRAAEATYEDATDPAVRDGWAIQDIGSLEWAMSRIADLQEEQAENEVALAEAHKRLDARAAQLQANVNKGLFFFRAEVLRYMEAHKAELLKGGRRKSRSMLHGIIGWRSAGGRLKVTDKDALATWLMQQPVELGLARIKVEPEMRALQDYCRSANIIPPGTELEPEREVAFVNAISPGTTLAKTEE
jgi:phage host-nuclease inhibitor protein Gam